MPASPSHGPGDLPLTPPVLSDTASTAASWLPVAVTVILLAWVESVLPAELGEAPGRRVRLVPEAFLQFAMLSGVGCLAAWFLGLHHLHRCTGRPWTTVGQRRWAPLVALSLGGVWALTMIGRFKLGEEIIALGLFVYLPTLAITFGVAAGALRRLVSFWPGAAALAGLALVNLACQVLSLAGQGRGREQLIFALPSVPIAAAVAFWLVADARSSPGSPALPGS